MEGVNADVPSSAQRGDLELFEPGQVGWISRVDRKHAARQVWQRRVPCQLLQHAKRPA